MSVAELLPTISALPRGDKIELMQFIAAELARDDRAPGEKDTSLGQNFVLPPEDNCPYTPAELAQMFEDVSPGVALSEIWRKPPA